MNDIPRTEAWLAQLQHAATRETAWETFLEQYSRLILKVIWQSYDDYDTVMEVYARVLHRLRRRDFALLRKYDPKRYDPPPRFATYLAAVVYRISKEPVHISGSRPDRQLREGDREVDPFQEVDVRVLLEQLPAEERTLLSLFYLEERTAREIAQMLHIPVRQVYYRIQKTLARLHARVA